MLILTKAPSWMMPTLVVALLFLTPGMTLIRPAMADQDVITDEIPINFHGTITSPACTVDDNSKSQSVPLGAVPRTSFVSAGDVSEAKPFTIVMNCPAQGTAHATVTFSGTPASDPTLLALDDENHVAQGIAVRINQQDGTTQVKLNTPSAAIEVVEGINTLNFTAQYQALTARSDITVGPANATAQFSVNYP